MARTTTEVEAPPEAVWEVLADAASFGDWVVGTRAIVRADVEWPEVGSSIDYEVGVGAVTVGDHTTVIEADPPRLLVLRAELQQLGAAMIRLELEAVDGRTRVVMDEEPVEGLAGALHTRLSDFLLARRNDVGLDRLRGLAEARR